MMRDDDTGRGIGREPERLPGPQGDADAVGGVERPELLGQMSWQRIADCAEQPQGGVLAEAAAVVIGTGKSV